MKIPDIDLLRWEYLLKKFQRQKRIKKKHKNLKQHKGYNIHAIASGGSLLKPVNKQAAIIVSKTPAWARLKQPPR